jgi:hypothetical protein
MYIDHAGCAAEALVARVRLHVAEMRPDFSRWWGQRGTQDTLAPPDPATVSAFEEVGADDATIPL